MFLITMTDLFCGELNYSYVARYVTTASTPRGAITKLSKLTGLNFRNYLDGIFSEDGESVIYHSTSKLTAAIVEPIDESDLDDRFYEVDRI
jgi:beta-xylosidase